jgi:integrase
MASIANDPGGRRRILFMAPDERRKTIRLGKCDRKSAEAIARHVEALLGAKMSGQSIPRDTAAWLSAIGAALRDKLAAVGLIEATRQAALGEFLRSYILSRPDVKPATLEVWLQPCRNLTVFFGDDKPLRNITTGDCDQFKAWLLTLDLAPATVAKRLSFARTFLHVARKHKLIDENPFSEVKIPTANVSARQRFIDRSMMQKLFDVANPTWRTIIALARYGGLRCPSEVLSLEWRHVDWERSRITVPSPKTDRYDGKGTRTIPLFPELRTYLEEAYELAEPDQTHIVGAEHLAKAQGPKGWRNCNLRTTFGKLVKRASLEPWPRLFHNLRSSRETELLESFPVHVVALWMGHDAKVSLKHYAQTTEDHFDRAAGCAISGAPEAQNPAQQTNAGNGSDPHECNATPERVGVSATSCDTRLLTANGINGGGGFEPPVRFDPHTAFPVTDRVGLYRVSRDPKGTSTDDLRWRRSVNRHTPAFRNLFCKPEVSPAVRQFVNRMCQEGRRPAFQTRGTEALPPISRTPERLRSLAGPAARNVMSRITVMPARSSATHCYTAHRLAGRT